MSSHHRKALNDQKEMKLLLDMYKGVSKEQRDKVQLMAQEKKNRAELEELRQQIKKIQVRYMTYSVLEAHTVYKMLLQGKIKTNSFFPYPGKQT